MSPNCTSISIRELKQRLGILGMRLEEPQSNDQLLKLYQDLLARAKEEAPKLGCGELRRLLQHVGESVSGKEDVATLQARYLNWIDNWTTVQVSPYQEWLSSPQQDLLCAQLVVSQPKDIRYACITAYPGDTPPYILENRTRYPLRVSQRRFCDRDYSLPQQSTRGFCWEMPNHVDWVLALRMDAEADSRLAAWAGLSFMVDLKEGLMGQPFTLKPHGMRVDATYSTVPEITCKIRHAHGGAVAVSFYERVTAVAVVSRSPVTGMVFETVLHLERLSVSVIENTPKLREVAHISCSSIQTAVMVTSPCPPTPSIEGVSALVLWIRRTQWWELLGAQTFLTPFLHVGQPYSHTKPRH